MKKLRGCLRACDDALRLQLGSKMAGFGLMSHRPHSVMLKPSWLEFVVNPQPRISHVERLRSVADQRKHVE